MTVFENIKANNWPSQSNAAEDRLLVALPLNSDASLNLSEPVKVGSTVVQQARNISNANYVKSLPVGTVWSKYLSGNLKTPEGGFNGQTGSGRSEGTGGLTFTPPGGITVTSSVEVYDNNNVTESAATINGVAQSAVTHSASAWVTVYSGSGTLDSLYTVRTDNAGWDAGFYAIKIDGNLILTDALSGEQKFYDSNAYFTGVAAAASSSYLTIPGLSFYEDFTLEFWTNPAAVADTNTIFDCFGGVDAGFYMWTQANGSVSLVRNANTYHQASFFPAGTLTVGTWTHMAVVRSGQTITAFADGVAVGTYTLSTSLYWTNTTARLGSGTGNGSMSGYSGRIQDFRFYKTAKYTSTFTPPSAILS